MEITLHCSKCSNEFENGIKFQCTHLVCSECFLYSLLQDHLIEFQQYPIVEFTCCNQSLLISLSQILDILTKLNQSNRQIEPSTPPRHKITPWGYCCDCNTKSYMCRLNIDLYGENYIKLQGFAEELNEQPSFGFFYMEELEQNLKKDFSRFCAIPSKQKDNKFQARMRSEMIKQMKKEYERACLVIKIIKQLYIKRFLEINKTPTDFTGLMFFNQFQIYTPTYQFFPDKTISKSQLAKMNNKVEIKITFDEIALASNTFTCAETITGHQLLHSLLQLKDGRLVGGLSDSKIRIWEMSNNVFQCTVTLTGHKDSVLKLIQLFDTRLASASSDKTIRIWKMEKKSFKCTNVLSGHNLGISSLVQLKDGRIVSGSGDSTMKIWTPKGHNFICTDTLTGHESYVSSLILLHDLKIASGSYDRTIKIWDTIGVKFICIHTITGHRAWVNCMIQLRTGHIVAGTGDIAIKIWKLRENSYCNTRDLYGHSSAITSLVELQDGRFASGSNDKTIKIWKLGHAGHEFIQSITAHSKSVFAVLQLNEGEILSASEDYTIKIWK